MVELIIDGIKVKAEDGLSVLEAAQSVGIDVPNMCFNKKLGEMCSCMVCVVRIEGRGGYVPSCGVKVEEGMVVWSEAEDVIRQRRRAVELLLSEHLGDCVGPCEAVCPSSFDVPLVLKMVESGDYVGAAGVVFSELVLPGTLGKVCTAPCEKRCRRGKVDEAIGIRNVHGVIAKWAKDSGASVWKAGRDIGKRVVVVGAGASGLACAAKLVEGGVGVEIIEANEKCGGHLRDMLSGDVNGIEMLDWEIEGILSCLKGVKFGVKVGGEMLEGLCQEYDSVVLAVGEFSGEFLVERENLFVCGEARSRMKMPVGIVASGKGCSEIVLRYLNDGVDSFVEKEFVNRLGAAVSGVVEAYRERGTAGVSGLCLKSLDDAVMDDVIVDAGRCLHCECSGEAKCRLRVYAQRLGADSRKMGSESAKKVNFEMLEGVVFEEGKCIGCGMCVKYCEQAGLCGGMRFEGRGFEQRVLLEVDDRDMDRIGGVLRGCAEICPVGAIVC